MIDEVSIQIVEVDGVWYRRAQPYFNYEHGRPTHVIGYELIKLTEDELTEYNKREPSPTRQSPSHNS